MDNPSPKMPFLQGPALQPKRLEVVVHCWYIIGKLAAELSQRVSSQAALSHKQSLLQHIIVKQPYQATARLHAHALLRQAALHIFKATQNHSSTSAPQRQLPASY
jgi:hypothetical protein